MTIEEWAKDFKSYVNELQIPNDDYKGIMSYIDDAILLLKEQEVKDIKSYYGLGGPHGACPSCCTTIPRIIGQETRFCPFCGQAVKWK